MQVPLSSVKGTGPDGRILKADIEDYLGELLFMSSTVIVILLLVMFCVILCLCHGFKSWKQPLAEMQGKVAYI
jgi:hypothetical protein